MDVDWPYSVMTPGSTGLVPPCSLEVLDEIEVGVTQLKALDLVQDTI